MIPPTTNTTTTSSSSTSNNNNNNNNKQSSILLELDTKRQNLELEAQAITHELTQPTICNNNNNNDDGNITITKPMGIDTPLVDDEGYPRNDIDIYRARGLRKRLNEIKFDYKEIMKEIESHLTKTPTVAPATVAVTTTSSTTQKSNVDIDLEEDELQKRKSIKPKPKFDHKTGKWVVCNWDGTVAGVENGHLRSFHNLNDNDNSNDNSIVKNDRMTEEVISNELSSSCTVTENQRNNNKSNGDSVISAITASSCCTKPFAKVNEIHPSSPAAMGGLKLHDVIVKVGQIDCDNHKDLHAVGEVVQRAFLDGQTIDFLIDRYDISSSSSSFEQDGDCKRMIITVKPGYWDGNGILGCRIVKI